MKKLQYVVIIAAMLALAAFYLKPSFQKEEETVKTAEDTCTVAIVPAEEFTVVSSNPMRVKKGENAEFEVSINENYYCVDTDLYRCVNDKIIVENVSSDRSFYIKTIRKYNVTVEEAKNGTVELINNEGTRFCEGDTAELILTPKDNYLIEGILINDVLYPVRSDGGYTLKVDEDCTVRGLFAGVEKNFVLAKKNIGRVEVSGNKDYGRFLYGDELVLSVVPTEGIIFKGWTTGGFLKDGGVIIGTGETYAFTLTEDTEIYANFLDVNNYSASFVADHETGEVKAFATLSADEYGELPIYNDVKKREGYLLTGFNTEADMSGDSYCVGSMFVMPHNNVTFYPEWTKCADPDKLEYSIKSGKAVISGIREGAVDENGTLCIPDNIDGTAVSGIGADAFSGNSDIRTLILPPGLSSLGDRALKNCTNLKTVYLVETISAIGKDCFANCEAFTDLRLIQSYAKVYDLDYDSALAEIYMRLKNTEGPRIILVGGSNLSFGINSEILRKAFPKYDVVNFSTTYLYGLSPLLDLVDKNVHEGDVVILAPECYLQMYCAKETTSFNNWEYVDCNPDMLKDINIKNNTAFLNTALTFFYNKRVHSPKKVFNSNPVYSRSGFNEYGDLVTARTGNKVLEPVIPYAGLITDKGMKRINEACRSFTEKGAKCYFTFTSLSLGSKTGEQVVKGAKTYLSLLDQKLDKEVVPIISDLEDYLFDTYMCYGICYHLTLEGAELRTEQLVKDLSAYLE